MTRTVLEIWRDGANLGSRFVNGENVLRWEDLSREEQLSFLNALSSFYSLYSRFLKKS